MPETVRMALARYCQRETNVTVQEKKQVRKFPLDKGHFITVKQKGNRRKTESTEIEGGT